MDFAERVAHNEEAFRLINERIEAGAEMHAVDQPISFHCECGNAHCDEAIRLLASDYKAIFHEPHRFVVVSDHVIPEVERVVERREGYAVVEKTGEAAEEIDQEEQDADAAEPTG